MGDDQSREPFSRRQEAVVGFLIVTIDGECGEGFFNSLQDSLEHVVQGRIDEGWRKPKVVAGKVVHQPTSITRFLCSPHKAVGCSPKGRNNHDNRVVRV
jgi:hypothetical protein